MLDENEKLEASSVESVFDNLFQKSASASGEEEILRLGSNFARQITAEQMRILIFLKIWSLKADLEIQTAIDMIINKYVDYKQYHRSDMYVMRIIESLSLRRFLNENSMKVNVMKN